MSQPQNNDINRETRIDQPRLPADGDDSFEAPTPRKKTSLPLYIGIGIAAVLILIAAAAALSKHVRHELAISIVRQPTPYTQLYFTHPGTLPAKLKVGHKGTFEFTIVNDENQTYRYTYVVTLVDSKQHLVVSSETATVSSGQTATRSVTIAPAGSKSPYLVTVTLKGVNQSISFHGVTSAPKAAKPTKGKPAKG
jgi:Protein of unknown function (DUF1616)